MARTQATSTYRPTRSSVIICQHGSEQYAPSSREHSFNAECCLINSVNSMYIYIYIGSSCQLFFASAKRKFIAIMTCRLDSQCQAKFQRPAKFPVPSESAYEMLSLDIYQWPAKSTSTYFDQVAEIVRHVCGRPGHDWQIVNGPGKSDLRLFMDTLLKGPSCGPTHVAPDHEAPDAEMSEVYINGVEYYYACDDTDGEVMPS